MNLKTNCKEPGVIFKPFGKTEEGQEVLIYSLINENGLRADITNYGGIIVRFFVPDRNGQLNDIVLGYNNLEKYLKENDPYLGAIIGRYGNRIAEGEFTLQGKTYKLAQNHDTGHKPCHLHGGEKGFDKVIWEAESFIKDRIPGLKLHYLSEDGEEGYPGNLDVNVTYKLNNNNNLQIHYKATTDKATPLNLTQHSYFNLKGEGRGKILNHIAQLNADQFLPINKSLIPTGEFRSVQDTPFDFSEPREIGDRINEDNKQLQLGSGYDHNYVLNSSENVFDLAARVYEPGSGREMEVWTTEPGVQFYTGNNLDGEIGKSNRKYQPQSAFCLETQHYPDSPNQDNFPSTILNPDDTYESITEFRFDVR